MSKHILGEEAIEAIVIDVGDVTDGELVVARTEGAGVVVRWVEFSIEIELIIGQLQLSSDVIEAIEDSWAPFHIFSNFRL